MNVIDIIKKDKLMDSGISFIKKLNSLFPGTQSLIVGGCVRDIILGLNPHDVDIATNISIDDIVKNFHTADIGKSKDFGIVLVIFDGYEFEVAHFREEFGSNDNRHPSEVHDVYDFKSDSSRRDITINALGIDSDGNIVDYQNALEDINNKIIRAVGIAENRFEEDALRIFRVARFAAKFGFEIENKTKEAMFEKRNLTKNISIERIRDELINVASISGKALVKFIDILNDVKVLDIHFPEINKFHGYHHGENHHPEGDLYEHTIASLNVSRSNNPLTNIAILFHDIGKMCTQTFDENGKVHYNGHEKEGSDMFLNIGKKFKFSNNQIESIRFAIENHMIAHRFNEMKKKKIVEFRQNPNFAILKDVARADDEARMHLFDEEDFNMKMDRVEQIFNVFGEKQEFENRMKNIINGNMIIDIAKENDIKIDGCKIGSIKNFIREKIIERNFNITDNEVKCLIYNML